jgi:putative endonuclease
MNQAAASKTRNAVLGKSGEEEARRFLLKKGYEIIAQNYRSPFGEVDLICKDQNSVVFVEVKTRKNLNFGDGAEAVVPKKQKKIIKTALYFLKNKHLEAHPYRFDVVSILSGGDLKISYIPHAFP